MFRGFHFRLNRFIIGIVLIAGGLIATSYCVQNPVEFGQTDQMFTNPTQKLTEDYVTGRFG